MTSVSRLKEAYVQITRETRAFIEIYNDLTLIH